MIVDVLKALIEELKNKPRIIYRFTRRRVKVNGKVYEYVEVRDRAGTKYRKAPVIARLKPGDPRLQTYECSMWRGYAYAYAHALLTALQRMNEVCEEG